MPFSAHSHVLQWCGICDYARLLVTNGATAVQAHWLIPVRPRLRELMISGSNTFLPVGLVFQVLSPPFCLVPVGPSLKDDQIACSYVSTILGTALASIELARSPFFFFWVLTSILDHFHLFFFPFSSLIFMESLYLSNPKMWSIRLHTLGVVDGC